MNISFMLVSIFLIFPLLTSCNFLQIEEKNKSSPEIVLEGKTMGTSWRISMVDVNKQRAAELDKKIQSQLNMIDNQLLSTYKKNSELMRFNQFRDTSMWPVNEILASIVIESLRIGQKTNGAMDITIGSLVNLWGFGPNKQPEKIPSREKIRNIRNRTGLNHLMVISKVGQQFLKKDIPDLFVDLSTVGEGYAADYLANLMMKEKISRYLVSVGGSLVGRGMNAVSKPWRIAIQKPTDQENAIQTIVNINGYGISTSGNYRNYYELNGKRIFHIIDPKTGYPITNDVVSVTVIAESALEADAWDTGLMVLGSEGAKKVAIKNGLAVYMITKQNNTLKSWISPQFITFLDDIRFTDDNHSSSS